MPFVLPFRDVTLDALPRVGGKTAALGELIRSLGPAGVRVPDGFAVTADAFQAHLRAARLEAEIYPALERPDVEDLAALAATARAVREKIRAAPLPPEIAREIEQAYAALSLRFGEAETDVAVRASATAEDLPTASFAGQQETYLNVRGVSVTPDSLARVVQRSAAPA